MSQGSNMFVYALVILLMVAALGLIVVLVVDGVDWSFLEFEESDDYAEPLVFEDYEPDYEDEEPLTLPDPVEVELVYSGELLNTTLNLVGSYDTLGNAGRIIIAEGSGGIYPVEITVAGETTETVGFAFGEKYFAFHNPDNSTLYLFAVDDGAINGYYVSPDSAVRNSITASVDGVSFAIPPLTDIFHDAGLYEVNGINSSGSTYSDSYYLKSSGIFLFVHRGNPDDPVGAGMLIDDYLITVVEGYLNLYRWTEDHYEGIWVQYPGDEPGSEALTFVESN